MELKTNGPRKVKFYDLKVGSTCEHADTIRGPHNWGQRAHACRQHWATSRNKVSFEIFFLNLIDLLLVSVESKIVPVIRNDTLVFNVDGKYKIRQTLEM